MRQDNRKNDQLREITISPHYVIHPEGSVLFSIGDTKVLCNATIEDTVPHWKKTQGLPGGWVTAEYAMLPRSTNYRIQRENWGFGARTQEIRRLIGRSLRGAVDLEMLGPRTCTIDCDVIQADGGTRTASITGGYIALRIALNDLISTKVIPKNTITRAIAAVSVGIVEGTAMLDLSYEEDSKAEVDLNVVMTDEGEFVEVQGTAEGKPFSRFDLNELLNLAQVGIKELIGKQNDIFGIL